MSDPLELELQAAVSCRNLIFPHLIVWVGFLKSVIEKNPQQYKQKACYNSASCRRDFSGIIIKYV